MASPLSRSSPLAKSSPVPKSSPYPVLDNKPIDQWKVTELKEELRRRKLPTKGLKDDLIRRLDEALRVQREANKEVEDCTEIDTSREENATPNEEKTEKEEASGKNEKGTGMEEVAHNERVVEKKEEASAKNEKGTETEEVDHNERANERKEEAVLNERDIAKEEAIHMENDSAKEEVCNGVDSEANPEVKIEVVEHIYDGSETGKGVMDDVDGTSTKLEKGVVQEGKSVITINSVDVVSQTTVVAGSVETNITESRSTVTVESSSLESLNKEIEIGKEDFDPLQDAAVPNDSIPDNQVSEVSPSLGFQVKSDSISTDSVSINEKNELKGNLNADNFHIELDNVKPEMVLPSSSNIPYNGGDIPPLDDQEPCESQGSLEGIDDITTNVDLSKKIDSLDGGSSEKLNLDRSSGDDSMEEDVLESKQVESNHVPDDIEDKSEPIKDHVMIEGSPVGATGVGFSPNRKDEATESKSSGAPFAEKRKLEDQEVVRNNEPPKRRRWNTETIKIPDPQSSSIMPSTTPRDAIQSKFSKRNFNRSDSALSGGETPKERVVPPSPKSPTTSLKIDRFLRPFTLKAVQELLAKTGTVCSFWMDHIKTHCYVTFSSVEEAIETRNGLYNLQWPPNGGRLLVAEFVDPQEVKIRAEAPPQPSPAPVSNKQAPTTAPSQLQPSPRQNVPKQQLPPPPSTLPPPPPLSDPLIVRERLSLPLPPPPPPPLTKKPDPPIVTLDDLFKKTKATPRIYYLPLSEEQVAAKLAAQGKNIK
ncbi:Apoptotic chromatin condensation inducer in the nucleus [Thalictrum thalictroides]|uniref:Apoptotic chromatin condensation inducer in the nucleus n=1 Tax=Thalictrum thalictroides TaxID=46969 RepID=A0A7J6WFV1_THATH|nr:Apoptotic chromatin condensation inducer in the nucleus [Thalictrum thalictroides]